MTDRSESLDTVIQSTNSLSSPDGIDGRYNIAATPTIDKPPDKDARYQARLQLAIMMGLAAMPTEPHSAFLSTASKLKIKQTNDTIVIDWVVNLFNRPKAIQVKLYYVDKFRSIYSNEQYIKYMESFSGRIKKTGAGKSGSDMYWSENRQQIAKTMAPIEISNGRRIFPAYCDHIKSEAASLLARYYAMMRIRIGTRTVYITCMENVFGTFKPTYTFDLKGSTHGRRSGFQAPIMKDLDFVESGFRFGFRLKQRMLLFLRTLYRDVRFLQNNGMLDYSLLAGFHGGEWSCGIIDILTQYTPKKVLEHAVLGTIHGKRKISCAPPEDYGVRFCQFIWSSVDVAS